MSADSVAQSVRERLAALADRIFERNPQRIYVDVPPENTLAANRIVYEDLGGRLATASGVDERDRIEMLYHYCMDGDGVVVTIRTWALKPEVRLDSVAQFLPAAGWIEREVQDLLGVTFVGHPDPRRLILADEWPEGVYPLRRDYPARRSALKDTPAAPAPPAAADAPGAQPQRSTAE